MLFTDSDRGDWSQKQGSLSGVGGTGLKKKSLTVRCTQADASHFLLWHATAEVRQPCKVTGLASHCPQCYKHQPSLPLQFSSIATRRICITIVFELDRFHMMLQYMLQPQSTKNNICLRPLNHVTESSQTRSGGKKRAINHML